MSSCERPRRQCRFPKEMYKKKEMGGGRGVKCYGPENRPWCNKKKAGNIMIALADISENRTLQYLTSINCDLSGPCPFYPPDQIFNGLLQYRVEEGRGAGVNTSIK